MADDIVFDVHRNGNCTVYRDVEYAVISGFRPLLLDLVVPDGPSPPPLVLYLHGGGFASGRTGWPGTASAAWSPPS